MSTKNIAVKFDVESDGDSSPNIERKTVHESLKIPKKKASKNQNFKKIKSVEEKKTLELVDFLNSENRPIVQKSKMIDDEERSLLERIGKRAIDLDGLLKFKEPQAKDKLWKIPYSFKNNSSNIQFNDGDLSRINRFGTGISDGCFVSLSLPVKHKKTTNWDDINREADEALEAFEMAKMSRLNRTRRGSILQPTHVYLTPNPETGHTEYIIGHSFLASRGWQSEFKLNSSESDNLIGPEFKEHICENISMDNLDNLPFANVSGGLSGGNASNFTDSEIQFFQAVQNRRRASLMPPKAGGGFSDLAFQRASFAGGGLWSPDLERARRKAIYYEKVKLVNPDYNPPDEDNRSYSNDDDDDKQSVNGKDDDVNGDKNIQQKDDNSVEEQYYPELNSSNRFRAKIFAHELTLIVRQHFVAIKESEIVNFITNSVQHVLNNCPNIKGLLHFQNRVIRLISTYILKHDELEERVDAILFFLETIRQLYLLGNWHSVNLIVQSLQCPPVVRLKETWRKITFQHNEDYCYFLDMSEHLRMGKECIEYETLTRFLPIFDDVIDEIKEKCGLKLILIQQNRQQSNWGVANNHNIASWVHDEVEDLKESAQKATEIHNENQNVTEKKKPVKLPFFRKLFFCSGKITPVKNKKQVQTVEYYEPTKEKEEGIILDENSNQQLLNSNNQTKMPSCKKFWSIADYNKLSAADKELIKQEIVRTFVAFQKAAFFVFEDRDPELRDFLLNCRCETMESNMKRSREILEETSKKPTNKNLDSQISSYSTNTVNSFNLNHGIQAKEVEQILESRHGGRRVMFAQDFDEDLLQE